MIRIVMLSLVLMLTFPASGWAEGSSGNTIRSSISILLSGEIEAIDRKKKTKITVNGVMYVVSRSIKVRVMDSWERVSDLSVGDNIRFMTKEPKRSDQLPEMISITLQLN
ncbi:hypothetical protein [Neptunomonas antarctica]|uniref:DUF5666 domain-containing protein n=1 Tax=Neptunomonas antarctica TaxID=619304 RepID=A0A1N7MGP3_9GAMM|nr:hypothetical protein [Neptunomonas antarctica]SIS85161.1 hypothetical protein SAMN05421760_10632 [Neptunomonas antarctica]